MGSTGLEQLFRIWFWLYGNNTGGVIFVDILDNRNPGSTTDDAERFVYDINDDFDGWQYFGSVGTNLFVKMWATALPMTAST